MSHLLKRYSLAGILSVGDFARWIDGLCSDFVFSRTTNLSWKTIRLARDRGYLHEDLREFDEAWDRGDFTAATEELAARLHFNPEKGDMQ